MPVTPLHPAASARHLLCLDLVGSELRHDPSGRAGPFQPPIENCRRMLDHGRAQGWTITHIYRRTPGDASAAPVEGLKPGPYERVLYRTGVSAFSNRSFRRTLQLTPGAELIILSFSLSASCLTTALTAHDWNFPVTLIEDGFQPAPERDALQTVARTLAEPFVCITRAESFLGARRHLRLVSDTAAA